MNLFYLSLGILLFIITALDIIKTTFSSNGGGKITSSVARVVWKSFFFASGRNGRSILLQYAGPAVLVSILFTWIVGLWAGLFLVLLGDADSVVNSKTMMNASVLEKLYYAGFSLSTLGVGDFIASSITWRIVTSVSAFSGLVFITTSITYFVPVLQAVGLQSKLSLYMNSMGKTPQEILVNSWNGRGFSDFLENVPDICQMLIQHTMHHHSYPVIHYFHNRKPKLAIAPAIVLLDETHQLLKHAVAQSAEMDKLKMTMLQTALEAYLEMVKGSFLKNPSPKETPPFPDLRKLEERGIPLKSKEEIRQAFSANDKERKLITAVLEMDGWSWQDVYSPS